ncbi:hypothetical protein Taro_048820 [Colocasia esculenta]|uniref:Uncharacterized protein n=1 Tax=Colocasia esculenta TaxID=4460 RepID=A0A843X9B4_COLES|nr:hypothetical protein [Colocasia esculenta]
MVTSPVGCLRFSVSQAVSFGLCPAVLRSRLVCVVSLARLRPVRRRRIRDKHVTGLTGLDEAFRHSWHQSKAIVMANRRDWGGGGDDPEESTQRMIERIWESLIDIRMRMDQQAPVPPVVGEAVPVAPVRPPPGVECVVSLVRLWPVRGRWTRDKHVTGLMGLDEAFRHSNGFGVSIIGTKSNNSLPKLAKLDFRKIIQIAVVVVHLEREVTSGGMDGPKEEGQKKRLLQMRMLDEPQQKEEEEEEEMWG